MGEGDFRLTPDQLYRRCDPDELGFETTAEVPPLDGTVGQERAQRSLAFGLDVRADGYNMFVAGPTGTGRTSTLRASVARMAAERPAPPDWCYVFNFRNHRQPSVISLPAGRGPALSRDVDAFVEAARREIPRLFESDAYSQRREELTKGLQEERERIFGEVEREARQRGFLLNATPMGIATVPAKDGNQPMTREEYTALPEEKQREIQERGEELQPLISQAMTAGRRLEREASQRLRGLERNVALFAITPLLNELRQEYIDIPKAVEFLEQVQDDIIEHLDLFRAGEQEAGPLALLRPPIEETFGRYKVNVFVAQGSDGAAPIIVEDNPTYYNLFGRVDYRAQLGAMTTDHTMIKAGAIHRANGGYLILQAMDVLTSPLVWGTLKRALRCREARLENFGEQFSAVPIATLDPQPIPLDVKVVFVGNPWLYYLLFRADEDFRKLFRVKADFSIDMEREEEHVALYAGFISSRIRDERLRPFDKSAVARIIEHGSRLIEHQEKLSTRFIEIADLLTEADYWAGKDGADIARAEHVERAIEEKTYRSNLLEERIQDLIDDGTIRIAADGAVVGQVNGISVYELGDHRFGRPSRITARVSMGRGEVTNIDREIQMAGRVHNKGFMILNGYLHGTYAQERPLAFSASIGFEQTYDEVEGDSASSAELYALLSALADVPVKQGIAVTGSVNQRGEIQPIGGAQHKIEGFFRVCKARGLTGDQGVMIPHQNVKNLMLNHEVVQACAERKFHIWPVRTIDEGIELLTGVPAGQRDENGQFPAGTVHARVEARLREFAEGIEKFDPRALFR